MVVGLENPLTLWGQQLRQGYKTAAPGEVHEYLDA